MLDFHFATGSIDPDTLNDKLHLTSLETVYMGGVPKARGT
jgi:hypothetical protein